MRARLWLVFVVFAFMVCPDVALADDSFVDSFGRGVDTFLGNGVNEQVTPERDYNERYEPSTEDVETVRAAPQTPLQGLRQFFGMQFRWDGNVVRPFTSTHMNLYYFIRTILVRLVFKYAVPMVFLWWGVRKVIRMVMGAWRKGRASM